MAVLLKGSQVAQAKREQIITRVKTLKEQGITPNLNIIMVGSTADARAYAKAAAKVLMDCGIACNTTGFPEDIKQDRLLEKISDINSDPSVHGILIMQPIPRSIEWGAVQGVISPEKDVDCITTHNLSMVFQGAEGGLNPCTAQAVMEVLDHYDIDVEGKKVVVIGRSLVVGKPVAMLLLGKNATVTICHSRTEDLAKETLAADIIIAAAGQPKLVGPEHVKENSIVIDVGINVVGGKMVGDVDFQRVEPKASRITPVPGGVGSVTTSVLMENLLTAAEGISGKWIG